MIIKLLGFFLGFFITIILINYLTIENLKIETFKNLDKFADTPTPTPIPTPASPVAKTPDDLANSKLIPSKDNKYMCINTFNSGSANNKIINAEKRWYECDLESIIGIERNEKHYFTYEKDINLIPNDINPNGSMGANINDIQLNGPKSFYFANNINTNELSEFSVIISAKIKGIDQNENNILFEMTGNTETTDNKNLQYSQSIVNVNIKKNPKNNFDIIITIGNVIYKGLINDIDRNSIINNDFIVIGLVYSSNEVNFYLNRRKFTYTNSERFKVKLGSAPLAINKDGGINMDLYSFIHYKTVIPIDEINKFTKNTYYYLSGLDFTISETSNKCNRNETPPEIKTLGDRLKELENNIITIIERKTPLPSSEPINEIKPLSLNTNDKETTTNKFLNWLF